MAAVILLSAAARYWRPQPGPSDEMGFDKFAWIKRLAADRDPRLTASDKFILVYAAQVNVRFGEDTLCVRQATLAANCATTDRQVRRAFTAGRQCGYLVLTQERQRGRGHTRADEHRLSFPHGIPDSQSAFNETPDELSGITASAPLAGRLAVASGREIPDKSVENTGQNGKECRTKSSEIPDNTNSSTSGNVIPRVFNKGFEEGFNLGFGQDGASQENRPNPQPGSAVDRMPKQTSPAPAVKSPPRQNDDVSEERERWVARQVGIAGCGLCDDLGDVRGELRDDGEPVRCWHGRKPA